MLDNRYKITTSFTFCFVKLKNLLFNIYYPISKISYLTSYILYLTSSILFLSCNKPVDKQTLLAYLNDPDNGLKKEIQSGDYKISLTYRPTDLLVEQELGRDSMVSIEKVEAKRKQFGAYHYFTLSMSTGDKDMVYSGAAGNRNFNELVTKINFRLAEYIYAVEDKKDTVYLADYFIPNLYGMGGKTQILLAFSKDNKIENKEIEVYLEELGFGLGKQKFVFREKDFLSIPSLKLTL